MDVETSIHKASTLSIATYLNLTIRNLRDGLDHLRNGLGTNGHKGNDRQSETHVDGWSVLGG